MKYSTVIFDLDGTLLDTAVGIMIGASYTADKIGGLKLTENQQRSFIGPPIIDSFIRECRFSKSKARKAVEIYRQRYREKGMYEAKVYPRINKMLELLLEQRFKTAVATLKRDDFAKDILKYFGLSDYINVIKGMDHLDSISKTDIIFMCLKQLKENDFSRVVLIGDSYYDAIGAEQVGIDFIAVTYGYGFKNREEAKQSKHIFIADSVDEIIRYLKLYDVDRNL